MMKKSDYDYDFGSSIEGAKDKWIFETNETLPFLTVAAKSRAQEFTAAYLWWSKVGLIINDLGTLAVFALVAVSVHLLG